VNLQSRTRYLMKETEFKKISLDGKEFSRLQVWLFNDLLLLAKKKEKGKYLWRASIPTDAMIIWDLDPTGTGL
jgi:hypothetical protein